MSHNVPKKTKVGQNVPKTRLSFDPLDRKLPIATLFEYRKKGLNYEEIGKICGVTKQAIHSRFQTHGLANYSLRHYVENRADIFAWMQSRLLFSLSDADIKRMAPDRRVWAAAVLYDKERLERGMSTENLSISSIAVHLQSTLAEHQERSKLLLEAMTERGICATIPADSGTIDTSQDAPEPSHNGVMDIPR